MDKKRYDAADWQRRAASAEAIGTLSALIDLNQIPPQHVERVKNIISRWDQAAKDCEEALNERVVA